MKRTSVVGLSVDSKTEEKLKLYSPPSNLWNGISYAGRVTGKA